MLRFNEDGNPTEFIVRASDPHGGGDSNANIKVFDGHGYLCAEERGTVSTHLPKGLYTVRIERFGEMREEVIIHRDTTNRSLDTPRRNSAMPMSDTRHTHEFLSGAAELYSRESTFDQSGANVNWPRLMIMVRGSGDDTSVPLQVLSDLKLYDASGMSVTDFGPTQIRPPQSDLYFVYSAQLKPGNYILARTRSERTEMLPISLYEGWDSFIFVPFQKGARLSATSVKMVRHNSGYNSEDELSAKVDAALLGLGSRLDLLNPWDREAIIYDKFQHPLMGLIGAHSHFQGNDRKEKLEGQMLINLWHLMPGSTDVIALLLMAMDRDDGAFPGSMAELNRVAKSAFGEKIGRYLPLSFPPMLNSALQAIMRATQELPDLVKQGSWLESAGNSSFGSGVWALWDQPNFRDPVKLEAESQTISVALPSTQRLYPAVKRAIANVSKRATQEILAQTHLEDYIEPTQSAIDEILMDVDDQVTEYSLEVKLPSMEGIKTVRDLVTKVRDGALPKSRNQQSSDSSKFTPKSEIEDWLIDLVHNQIDEDEFDAGDVAKRYAVPKRSAERAAKLPRPLRGPNFES